ncbi:phosphoglycerate dehydrogenase [Alkaliphilus peptidifermentans]|uniref:Phosphoglycerate dehydrogenase n=1 Tax=Alkaliphilus peptidifermentans DSM 18978 TaxID=1120976 RepID=A0A1G5ELR7_9FIRM|nr:phosphoglycerate dehydrogenase [Alkaliphilus peptidifermentans]SCY27610.1 Phosphoglycerate dehydrogenase [Alkaliphilus peptidifermentans DSM 18978]
MKALFTYDYGIENMAEIRKLGYETLVTKENEASYSDEYKDVEVLVCYNPFSTLDISLMKNLKWIQLSSIGIDQVPRSVVEESNIILTNNRGGYSIPMGEWIVLKTLEIYKNSYGFYERKKKKEWALDKSLLELYGKKILFIGTGTIAQEAAKRLLGFEMEIIGVNTEGRSTPGFNQCYPVNRMGEIIASSDIIVLSIPYTEKTHHLIDENMLKQMKQNAVLINVSRGSIINEAALINHLKDGNMMGVALDVFEKEPLPSNSPLWEMDRVLISSHNSWISEMRNERRYKMIYENLKRYIEGKDLLNQVNINRGY